MEIKNFEYCTLSGFAWATVSSEDREYPVQVCLVSVPDLPDDGKVRAVEFLEEIDASDCGDSEGLCGDCNDDVFEAIGRDYVLEAFFNEARENGITVHNY